MYVGGLEKAFLTLCFLQIYTRIGVTQPSPLNIYTKTEVRIYIFELTKCKREELLATIDELQATSWLVTQEIWRTDETDKTDDH